MKGLAKGLTPVAVRVWLSAAALVSAIQISCDARLAFGQDP
jgi:hypothetical protein